MPPVQEAEDGVVGARIAHDGNEVGPLDGSPTSIILPPIGAPSPTVFTN